MVKQSDNNLTSSIDVNKRFSTLTRDEREQYLIEHQLLTRNELDILNKESSLNSNLANQLIENVIGTYPLPLGIAVNFVINKKPYVIPMVTEETSIIAAASKTAKWIAENGSITTKTMGHCNLGQVQIPFVKNPDKLRSILKKYKETIISILNEDVAKNMASRGGGVKDIALRLLEREPEHNHCMAVIHVMVDTCDAMGANCINQICEHLKKWITEFSDEKVGMSILSNLVDTRVSQAKVIIHNCDEELGRGIVEASLFARLDPYRAATSNKGVMNGMDSVLLATGNDWRAVEAGVHAYAARSGQYRSITDWTMEGSDLIGVLEAPIQAGIVGGMTQLHPVAAICLNMLGAKSADELSEVIAAVGIVQNLGAIRALSTIGITSGHMKLHLSNLIMASDATENEIPALKKILIDKLLRNERISQSNIREILKDLRDLKP